MNRKIPTAIKHFTYKPLTATVCMLSILLLTGLFQTSVALAATACNTTDFEKTYLSAVDGRTTLAITKNAMTWNAAQALAQANGGRLTTISSKAQSDEIAAKLSASFTSVPAPSTGNKAWIGSQDIANTAVWTPEGSATPTLTPDRFTWANGSSAYTNFAPGQPDDYCTEAEKLTNPDRLCLGENWLAIGVDGTWSDEGDHGATPLQLKGVVEWPNTILDCVKEVTPPTVIPIETLPDADKGVQYCKDSYNLNLAVCVDTTDSAKLCPLEKLACQPVKAGSACPAGSTLDAGTNKCQSDMIATPATQSGGINYDRPIYSASFYPPNAGVTAGYGPVMGYCSNASFPGGIPVYPSQNYEYVWQDNWQLKPVLCYLNPASTVNASVPLYSTKNADPYTVNCFDTTTGSGSGPWPYGSSVSNVGCGVIGYMASTGGVNGGTYSCPSGGILSGSNCLSCAAGAAWNGATSKCEATVQCQAPAVFSAISNSCVVGLCPSDAVSACKSIVGDATLAEDGTPMTYCSPNQCQTDTGGMITPPTDPIITDPKDDGPKDPNGTCTGQIYIFNGRTMQCTKDDSRGQVGAIAKIVASIVVAICTAGAASGLVLAMNTALVSAGMGAAAAQAVVQAVVTGVVMSAVNTAIDASTTGVPSDWAMQAGINIASSAFAAYLQTSGNGVFTSFGASGEKITNTVSELKLSDSEMLESVKKATDGFSTMSNMPGTNVESYSGVLSSTETSSNLITTQTHVYVDATTNTIKTVTTQIDYLPASYMQFMQQAKETGELLKPAVNSGMLASYSTKKCCNPDKISATCSPAENEEWSLQAKGFCHVIGTYCDTKFLSMCMAHKESSCCFTSKLARIIHEQGRPQLKAFGENGGWGSVRSPNCRGFTPDEFQMLDFGQIDLSEYIADLTDQIADIAPKLTNYMESVAGSAESRTDKLTPAGE